MENRQGGAHSEMLGACLLYTNGMENKSKLLFDPDNLGHVLFNSAPAAPSPFAPTQAQGIAQPPCAVKLLSPHSVN